MSSKKVQKKIDTLISKKEVDDEPRIMPKIYQKDISIDSIPIPSIIKERIKKMFYYLYPNQVEAVSSFYGIPILREVVESKHLIAKSIGDRVILKKSKNNVITTATSSGKTFIAHFFIMQYLTDCPENNLAIYVVPLQALGTEKYNEFSQLYDGLYNVGLVIGSETKIGKEDRKYNILITTYEKMDHLLQTSREEIFSRLKCVVFDEIHWVNADKRGEVIERCIAKIRTSDVPILGLSATIGNINEFEKWLDAIVFTSSFRPVPLTKGLFINNTLKFYENGEVIKEEIYTSSEKGIKSFHLCLLDLFKKKDGVLYFRQSRRNVKSEALKLLKIIQKNVEMKPSGLELPSIVSEEDKNLQECIQYRVAFHHAGLSSDNRAYIEEKFIKKEILLLIPTPTLAAGVNVPAKWVFADYMAFRDGGYSPLPISEMHQMFGRSGRPQFDTEGYGILYAGDDPKPMIDNFLVSTYFTDEEDIVESKLSLDNIAMSCLGMIAGNYAKDIESLFSILKNTLAYHQSLYFRTNLRYCIQRALKDMSENLPRLLNEKEGSFLVTTFGSIVNQLYLDPKLAIKMDNFISDIDSNINPIMILLFIFDNTDVPKVMYKKTDTLWLSKAIEKLKSNEIIDSDSDFDLSAIKTALMLVGEGYAPIVWADNDTKEDEFCNNYDISMGDIEHICGSRGTINWILNGFKRIASFERKNEISEIFDNLEIRLKYGISNNLVNLCKLKQVGKSRAKALWDNGYRTIHDVSIADPNLIAKIKIGDGVIGKYAFAIQKDAMDKIKRKSKLGSETV